MSEKAKPPKGSYGWYSTNEEWVRISVDSLGVLQTS